MHRLALVTCSGHIHRFIKHPYIKCSQHASPVWQHTGILTLMSEYLSIGHSATKRACSPVRPRAKIVTTASFVILSGYMSSCIEAYARLSLQSTHQLMRWEMQQPCKAPTPAQALGLTPLPDPSSPADALEPSMPLRSSGECTGGLTCPRPIRELCTGVLCSPTGCMDVLCSVQTAVLLAPVTVSHQDSSLQLRARALRGDIPDI